MAGISDSFGRLCLALALWNGRDPILKERMFGLTGSEGNHGEDVKEYWWFLDALPSHALLKWRYHYPQQAFPYEDLVRTNRSRGKGDPEYELLDTGVFDHGYWIVEVTYAKAEPTDIVLRITARNAGPAADRIHVLPDPLVPQHLGLGARVPPAADHARRPGPGRRPPHPRRRTGWRRDRARTALRRGRCSATTRRTTGACSARSPRRPSRRTASTTTW